MLISMSPFSLRTSMEESVIGYCRYGTRVWGRAWVTASNDSMRRDLWENMVAIGVWIVCFLVLGFAQEW